MELREPAPTRWDIHFRVLGVPARITPGFWATQALYGSVVTFFFAFLVLLLPARGIAAGILGFAGLSLLVWLACAFVSVLLHELGHVAAARVFGARGRIVLTWFGGLAADCLDLYHRWERIVVLLAGPCAQLLFLGVLYLSGCFAIELPDALRGGPYESLADALLSAPTFLLHMNLLWPLVALLPIPPLDGGMVAGEVIGWLRAPRAAPWEQDPDWWKRGKRQE